MRLFGFVGLLACSAGDSSDVQREPDTSNPWASHFPAQDCLTEFTHTAPVGTQVFLAGEFNDWSSTATPLQESEPGVFSVQVDLPPGSHPYKLVEKDGTAHWRCDPAAPFFQCDAGYDPVEWNDCSPGADACNSLKIVSDCANPRLHLVALAVDPALGSLQVDIGFEPGSPNEKVATSTVHLDGVLLPSEWDGAGLQSEFWENLSPGRHSLDWVVTDTAGRQSNALHIPFWTDASDWSDGLLYFAFADRFLDGDSANNAAVGTVAPAADYFGGDWAGVESKLDDLMELGVRALWLTAPLDNAEGTWGADCGTDFSGYHGYWPTSSTEFEARFGGESAFRALVKAAHEKGLRVMVDWVGNQVHENHDYLDAHPEWFAETPLLCDADDNWNDFPETCWFDSFLPDVDYFQPEALVQMVEDAIVFAQKYDLDGYRVDAVKHMPRPVFHNLQSRIAQELEHAGGGFEFFTLGETFDGDRGLVVSYVGENSLDAQFDFPLYFDLRSAFLGWGVDLEQLEASFEASQSVYGSAPMSTFLGNHDVERFVTQSAEGSHGKCDSDGNFWNPAQPPTTAEPYARLRLAWTWLLSRPGVPLVYYGDELGLPGYFDPDNRQPMRFGSALSDQEAATRAHVAALGQARLSNKALSATEGQLWWSESRLTARLSQAGGDWALSVVNVGESERTISNSLAWAGMPAGAWRDVLTGAVFNTVADALTVDVPALGSRVLVWESP
jgi:glycosidase